MQAEDRRFKIYKGSKSGGDLMAGGEIYNLGRWRSYFIELIFKPALFAAALFSAAWMRHVCPPKCWDIEQIYYTAIETAKEIWHNPILEWKMGVFAYSVAAFCEADNAYYVFLRRYVKNLNKKWGGIDDKEKGKAAARQTGKKK